LQPFLRNYEAHPQQGCHIKLEVNAEGSIGADNKFKVFWVQPCASSGGGQLLLAGARLLRPFSDEIRPLSTREGQQAVVCEAFGT
jgi:hypothetical protein